MIRRPSSEYPKRDLTPEHTKRGSEDHGSNNDGPLHPEISAAYDYVHSVLDTSDYEGRYAWHGWALREAFLAGVSHAQKQGANVELTGAPRCGTSDLTAGLGAAVIVRGQVVAWFADFAEEAREWCTENHYGEWLTWRAKPPEIVPLTEAEYDKATREGAELAAKLKA